MDYNITTKNIELYRDKVIVTLKLSVKFLTRQHFSKQTWVAEGLLYRIRECPKLAEWETEFQGQWWWNQRCSNRKQNIGSIPIPSIWGWPRKYRLKALKNITMCMRRICSGKWAHVLQRSKIPKEHNYCLLHLLTAQTSNTFELTGWCHWQ